MRRTMLTAVTLMLSLTTPLYAAQTSIVGTVILVGPYGNPPGTFVFQLASQPTTGCPSNNLFEVSPTSVTDPESRKNIFATLLSAKLTGNPVAVVYDTGAFCDTMGFPAIYSLFLEPVS